MSRRQRVSGRCDISAAVVMRMGACLHSVSGESQPWRPPTAGRGWQCRGRQDGGHGRGRERRIFRKCLREGSSLWLGAEPHRQLDADGSLHPVNSDTATPPSLRRTWFVVLLISLYRKVTKKGASASGPGGAQTDGVEAYDSEDGSATGSDAPGSGTVTPKNGSATGSLKGGRAAAATMAGGRRRKAVRKR